MPPSFFIKGLAEIADRFDTIFCDIWGVVHNGARPYAGAVDALMRFRQQGGQVALISNSPMPSSPLVRSLCAMGVSPDAYDVVISSGETTRALLRGFGGKGVFFIGAEQDRLIYEGIRLHDAEADTADFILCTALYPHMANDPRAYLPLLEALSARKLPFICANPDHMVEVAGQLYHEAGAIASLYEELGGEAIYTGKPHPPIYALASQALEQLTGKRPDPARSLAIGDSLRTDMAGARNEGMAGLLISAGVHEAEVGERPLADVLAERQVSPLAAMDHLAW